MQIYWDYDEQRESLSLEDDEESSDSYESALTIANDDHYHIQIHPEGDHDRSSQDWSRSRDRLANLNIRTMMEE